jgi:hypothetical protein
MLFTTKDTKRTKEKSDSGNFVRFVFFVVKSGCGKFRLARSRLTSHHLRQ